MVLEPRTLTSRGHDVDEQSWADDDEKAAALCAVAEDAKASQTAAASAAAAAGGEDDELADGELPRAPPIAHGASADVEPQHATLRARVQSLAHEPPPTDAPCERQAQVAPSDAKRAVATARSGARPGRTPSCARRMTAKTSGNEPRCASPDCVMVPAKALANAAQIAQRIVETVRATVESTPLGPFCVPKERAERRELRRAGRSEQRARMDEYERLSAAVPYVAAPPPPRTPRVSWAPGLPAPVKRARRVTPRVVATVEASAWWASAAASAHAAVAEAEAQRAQSPPTAGSAQPVPTPLPANPPLPSAAPTAARSVANDAAPLPPAPPAAVDTAAAQRALPPSAAQRTQPALSPPPAGTPPPSTAPTGGVTKAGDSDTLPRAPSAAAPPPPARKPASLGAAEGGKRPVHGLVRPALPAAQRRPRAAIQARANVRSDRAHARQLRGATAAPSGAAQRARALRPAAVAPGAGGGRADDYVDRAAPAARLAAPRARVGAPLPPLHPPRSARRLARGAAHAAAGSVGIGGRVDAAGGGGLVLGPAAARARPAGGASRALGRRRRRAAGRRVPVCRARAARRGHIRRSGHPFRGAARRV